jgi:hypothetical protein
MTFNGKRKKERGGVKTMVNSAAMFKPRRMSGQTTLVFLRLPKYGNREPGIGIFLYPVSFSFLREERR